MIPYLRRRLDLVPLGAYGHLDRFKSQHGISGIYSTLNE